MPLKDRSTNASGIYKYQPRVGKQPPETIRMRWEDWKTLGMYDTVQKKRFAAVHTTMNAD